MFKPNYKLKSEVLEKGIDKLERKASKYAYCQMQVDMAFYENGEILENRCKLTDEERELIQYYSNTELYKEARKINNATYKRNKRLADRIAHMLSQGPCVFLTLTFTDKVLESTTKETRKRYVNYQLKAMSNQYVANIDFGGKNGREHYHAVVLADKVDRNLWTYGAINFERVRVDDKSSDVKLAKYVSKLTNHAIKDTCQRNSIIYSRN